MTMRNLFVITLVLLTSCSADRPSPTTVREIPISAGSFSGQQNLAVGPGGEIYLSWMELTDSGIAALKFATRTADGWSEARTIAQDEELLMNWADFPSLLPLGNGMLAAHWLSLVPEDEGYNVKVAVSRDDGQTWSDPVIPHRDTTPTEHGFVALAASPSGGFGAVWLDSRKLMADSDEVAMMYTDIKLDGTLGAESVVDGRVCECCQPSAVAVPGGILAVYRDRTETEVRDIVMVRFDGSVWSEPKLVFADNWQISACPINGPAIAAEGDNVAVAWFTMTGDKPKVQLALSGDLGNTFGSPVQIDDGNPIGRVDVVDLESGGAVVTWIEKVGEDAQVRARHIEPDGTVHPSLVIGATSEATSSGFPRMERSGGTVVFAWTDTAEDRIRTAELNFATSN